MEVNTVQKEGFLLVEVRGELEAENTDRISSTIKAHLQTTALFVIDLTGVPYIDSAGLGVILASLKTVRERGGDIRLCGLNPHVRRVFDLVDASKIVIVQDGLEHGEAHSK